MRHQLPFACSGQKIGLLGGSFDPPHEGHVHISREAMRRFALDQVWWLVSSQNPLKANAPADFHRRLDACRAVARHPKIIVTDLEAQFKTSFTAQTLARLLPLYPGVRFVWLMGADNLAGFHLWENWQGIMQTVPVGVLARSGHLARAGLSPTAQRFRRFRLAPHLSTTLARRPAPCWSLDPGPTVDLSSTDIRNSGGWTR